ncbi:MULTISPECIES: competence/damage-inducible protein A [Croceibacter]|jgi:nicotinamide-nucleotide amidase|uniref:CinA-like protein n=1 Tax=Croceibacter atlanticus (strain ATCC BAA-628 / JCM 21780 / CIP 108009 / IAM 15332 / KCTC 12090 / HTCC2559) TaxID=216432 RepID=A3UB86_CROAH|nr:MULTISPECIES: competence/damage-inducible protein A [Croceibacter]HAT70106.1 competence/damage-inducible protein A [Flavobacteriaceae bacterium]EAP87072.1 putative competence-damage inducible [Croceibacter atlanticus HTCC2559]MAM22226.1 competence/damage-inducible protein A [Croceibacter sp.]MBG26998.1 competence/damage-inducible protein A [Croceibacter sp.]MBW4971237.1 competence/damage-inducible protein A [Croceibacter atlanticus]|tara:strand:- start:1724 stop:2971 length:1248 start_codon:yes stop_codon:yes gene_type:complete
MNAEIITIGDEILIGQIVDTNSVFISKELNKIGVSVYQISSIQDDRQHILNALEEASSRADIILITGGLGPTKDDITKHTLCEYFNDTLVENKDVLNHVEHLFENYVKQQILDSNRMQALVPSKATVLHNQFGTAPGIWIEKDNKVYVSMPGVPYEMKGLIESEVIPRLQQKYKRPFILHKTVLTYGLGESIIADKIEDWETNLPKFIKLAYLPSLGKVRLRLTAKGDDEEILKTEIERQIVSLHKLIGDIIFGYEGEDSIEQEIGKLLATKNATLSLAESCTGGLIASRFTANPGASSYFVGGMVTYATQSKEALLGIDMAFITKYGVVSEAVAKEMADKVKQKFNSEYSISVTGVAGPTKGDSKQEVGTVFIGVSSPEETKVHKFNFGNHREKTTRKAVNKALELLLKDLQKL